jgi:pyridoxamine 5'-phosphate oxidase
MKDLNETLENLRVSYHTRALDFGDCNSDPTDQFTRWLDEAVASQCDEPNAFTLSTVEGDQPRGRVVLLKGLRNGNFVFYTNYASHKGEEISLNPKASMTFLWLPLYRQIRIEGVLSKVSAAESDEYFNKRPWGSQIGALSSPQSQRINNRQELEELFEKTSQKFAHQTSIPRPAHWGGYALQPSYVEFWQGRDNRMHDRIAYERTDKGWDLSRLAP